MHEPNHGASGNQGYEPTDIQLKVVAWFGVAVVILTFAGYIVGTFVTRYVNAQPPISDVTLAPIATESLNEPFAPGVRLQVDSPSAKAAFRAEQDHVATTFGVVSDQPEIYRIPVNTAMDIVAERGLPQFPKLEAPESAGQN